MRSFRKYVSKYLASFAGLVLLLLFINVVAFGLTFYGIMKKDFGGLSPTNMLEITAASASLNGISNEESERLRSNQIWAIYLDIDGNTAWEIDAPKDLPDHFTVRDVAVFAKGYLVDYPVFIRNTDDGMLILGYPQDSYMKLVGNYFSLRSIAALPDFFIGIIVADLAILFLAYYYSKRKVLRNTEPIIESIKTLSDGKEVSLSVGGELSEVANSVNKASRILSRQNEARANWISGVSHDIRTPLSMIMGYAQRIASDNTASDHVRQEAEIIQAQSVKIRDLVQDLNLVSQLEYEMQPLRKEPVRLSKLLRSYAAELLNTGLTDRYSIGVEIAPAAETISFDCDERLMMRAVNNLVQNSIRHNPDGCDIVLCLTYADETISISVSDNGVGLSDEKWCELKEKPHYMKSTDDRLDLRHGLGLILVRQIVEAHSGEIRLQSGNQKGLCVELVFYKTGI